MGRQRRNPAYDDPRYRRMRTRLLKKHRRERGYVCPGFQRETHLTTDLTIDHIDELRHGGDLLDEGNLQILCRSCNDRKRWHGQGRGQPFRAERIP